MVTVVAPVCQWQNEEFVSRAGRMPNLHWENLFLAFIGAEGPETWGTAGVASCSLKESHCGFFHVFILTFKFIKN